MVRRIKLAACLALGFLLTTLMLASHTEPVRGGGAIRGRWVEAQCGYGTVKLYLLSPDSPHVVELIQAAQRLPRQLHMLGGSPKYLPYVVWEPYCDAGVEPHWLRLEYHVSICIWATGGQSKLLTSTTSAADTSDPYSIITGGRAARAEFPIWPLIVGCAVYPVLSAVAAARKRFRARRGCCAHCGYNLTGLPEPRCPECGTKFVPRVLRQEKAGHGAN